MAYYTSLWYSITRKKNPQFICYWTDGQFRFQIFYIANSASVNTLVTESMSVHWYVSPGLLRHEGWTASILLAVIKMLPRWRYKEPACQCRRHAFDPLVGKSPWRRAWQPPPVFLPGESHGQRSLMGYSPQGHKEPGTTEAT